MSLRDVDMRIPIEDGVARYNVSSAVVNAYAQQGFPIPTIPTFQTAAGAQYFKGELPPDLTQQTDEQLGTLLGLLAEWKSYVDNQLAMADMERRKSSEILEFVRANIRLTYRLDEEGKKRPQAERDDFVLADRRYVEANSDAIYWETYYRLLKAVSDNVEAKASAVSRRITQRVSESDRNNRVGTVQSVMFARRTP